MGTFYSNCFVERLCEETEQSYHKKGRRKKSKHISWMEEIRRLTSEDSPRMT